MPANPLTAEELADAMRLKRLFVDWQSRQRDQQKPASQEAAASQLGFGQSALNQYLNGKIPLNVDAAIKFARLLDVPIEAFSDSLAEQVAMYANVADQDAGHMAGPRDGSTEDIIETRRENLRRWTAEHGTPYSEKSLFSQLKGTGSFGEKVARRLEDQYNMGRGFLDTPASRPFFQVAEPTPGGEYHRAGAEKNTAKNAQEASNSARGGLAGLLELRAETADELRLLTVYRLANGREREAIDDVVEQMRALIEARTRDQVKLAG